MQITTAWWGVAIHAEDTAELAQLDNLHQCTGPKASICYEEGAVELILPNTDAWVRLNNGVDNMALDSSVGCLLITR